MYIYFYSVSLKTRGQANFFIRWVLLPMISTKLDNMFDAEEWLKNECSDIGEPHKI